MTFIPRGTTLKARANTPLKTITPGKTYTLLADSYTDELFVVENNWGGRVHLKRLHFEVLEQTYTARTIPIGVEFHYPDEPNAHISSLLYRKSNSRAGFEFKGKHHALWMTDNYNRLHPNLYPDRPVTLITERPPTMKPITIPTTTNDMTLIDDNGVAQIKCGCFTGTIKQARELAARKHREDYSYGVKLLETLAKKNDLLLEKPVAQPGQVWLNALGNPMYLVKLKAGPKHQWVFLKTNSCSGPFNLTEQEFVGRKITFCANSIEEYYSKET